MVVDVIEYRNDRAEGGGCGGGYALVVPQKTPDDYVHQPLLHEFRARAASVARLAERVEIGAQRPVEGAVGKVRGQGALLENARKSSE